MIKSKNKKNWLLFILFILNLSDVFANTQWPMWERFKQFYISSDGRVIDPQLPEKKTTSEGQSYGLFFALVAGDQVIFEKLLHWTENNLAAGNLGKHLPAWEWGQNSKKKWTVLDTNSAADSDLWIAYDLLEAGRIWNNKRYQSLGEKLLRRILKEEVIEIPGLGLMLLPGKTGFNFKKSWRLNPSYLPPQLFARFALYDSKWATLEQNSKRLLLETSPKGFAPDWVLWKVNKGWQPDLQYPNLGSYNAIRVYLWVGMLAQDAPQAGDLISHFLPIVGVTQQLGAPPEKINTVSGKTQGKGPIGFSAALLPLLTNYPSELTIQKKRVEAQELTEGEYYNSVLRLFGEGWEENRFRFNAKGELILPR
ncbi:cellulose synthase complex periplasmic endoglucanase BcsZ [Fluoribacter dumoffii]|uniref:cellulose synthase complex periplasmic endoglucanase BcsZ n=1 Tax=Fluoribacter dumoffii TaxID=463 RepID=UPI00224445C2|nr:cellulose synthase complex periplasmic endoglucanase BcsZ [Fluoribacter dumoffii]MCW8384939.1 cellulose synthase complex periplasmic endoglucanase BcsZ [Fluoribacter dumoffii]MCW8418000.1 cellulose synthase complex periplasmic endoglucanase BcsZ [Fluoribacter dumoffii]MCW8454158.1 cellulose synthase complex periplasmic endoglucanase BcsZ [Fluoribacter dumoffii]MCW8461768.1 cellulose synthase complex periplasmic endoglucanase BcsZ [Fluoribacter dumoffii]MCW8481984.1 cellulose synthase comple